jgi:hypothetical protein
MSHPIQKSHAIASAIVAVLNHNQDHLRTSKELIAKTKTQGKKSYPTQDFLADHCVAYHCLQRFRQKNQTKNN